MICPNCSVGISPLWSDTKFGEGVDPRNPNNRTAFLARWASCSECRSFIIEIGWLELGKDHSLARYATVFPYLAAAAVPEHVPAPYANDFREASLILSVSPKASAALSRRVLQALLIDKGGANPKLDLDKQVEHVKPSLPPYISTTLHTVRTVGNYAVHPMKDKNSGAIIEVEEDEAELTLEAVRELLRFYFTEPAEAARRIAGINSKLAAAGKAPLKK